MTGEQHIKFQRSIHAPDGKEITNWKAYIRKWCATRTQNRRTA